MITAALANHPPIGSVLVVRGVEWRPLATLDPPKLRPSVSARWTDPTGPFKFAACWHVIYMTRSIFE